MPLFKNILLLFEMWVSWWFSHLTFMRETNLRFFFFFSGISFSRFWYQYCISFVTWSGGTSLEVKRLTLCPSTAGRIGLIPGQGLRSHMLWGTEQINKKVKNQPSKQKHKLGSMLLAVSLQSSGRICETEPSFFESPGELTVKLSERGFLTGKTWNYCFMLIVIGPLRLFIELICVFFKF